jgi:hypothetical protein
MKDEPWAWESKEMVRKMCVGKAVSFRSEPTKGATSREYVVARFPCSSSVQERDDDMQVRVRHAQRDVYELGHCASPRRPCARQAAERWPR